MGVIWVASLCPPFYSFTSATYVPDSSDPLVPVWAGPGEPPAEGPNVEDPDMDGLPDWFEHWLGTETGNPDTDYDGLDDGFEYRWAGTDPLNWDSDGDGYSDHDEHFECWAVNHHWSGFGVSVYDWDGDGTPNHLDATPMGGEEPPPVDHDADGVPDGSDSHPWDAALWEDWNGNGINDSSESGTGGGDPWTMDSDGDGVVDAYDSHPQDSQL